jgi:SM-20-related protein
MSELKLDMLKHQDYFEIHQFLFEYDIRALLLQIESLKINEQFRAAKVGQQKILHTNIRSDRICWIDETILSASIVLQNYFSKLEEIRSALNQKFFLGLHGIESHFAIYQPGQFYEKHIDANHKESLRVVSLICYLNSGKGGELKLHLENQEIKIKPEAGKLVGFLSRVIEHEVLVSEFERMTITSWFTRNPVIGLSL